MAFVKRRGAGREWLLDDGNFDRRELLPTAAEDFIRFDRSIRGFPTHCCSSLIHTVAAVAAEMIPIWPATADGKTALPLER